MKASLIISTLMLSLALAVPIEDLAPAGEPAPIEEIEPACEPEEAGEIVKRGGDWKTCLKACIRCCPKFPPPVYVGCVITCQILCGEAGEAGAPLEIGDLVKA
ncbi:hypothetical protein B0O99DRAFT_694883 [Bisporella sp. PMI_857]|nr:hypothetical protein B0O99DRAFT_694883 [Bisporella sp. PMI_857]